MDKYAIDISNVGKMIDSLKNDETSLMDEQISVIDEKTSLTLELKALEKSIKENEYKINVLENFDYNQYLLKKRIKLKLISEIIAMLVLFIPQIILSYYSAEALPVLLTTLGMCLPVSAIFLFSVIKDIITGYIKTKEHKELENTNNLDKIIITLIYQKERHVILENSIKKCDEKLKLLEDRMAKLDESFLNLYGIVAKLNSLRFKAIIDINSSIEYEKLINEKYNNDQNIQKIMKLERKKKE